MTKEIKLTQGKVALVDDADFEWLNQWKWYVHGFWYAARMEARKGKRMVVLMHRKITNAPFGMDVDHINGNGLDNRRENLRVCTHAENQRNTTRKRTTNKSGFKGVCWRMVSQKWSADITLNSKQIHIGLFSDIQEAVRAYDAKAIELFGEFAKTNF
jgi:HNH endonuclease